MTLDSFKTASSVTLGFSHSATNSDCGCPVSLVVEFATIQSSVNDVGGRQRQVDCVRESDQGKSSKSPVDREASVAILFGHLPNLTLAGCRIVFAS